MISFFICTNEYTYNFLLWRWFIIARSYKFIQTRMNFIVYKWTFLKTHIVASIWICKGRKKHERIVNFKIYVQLINNGKVFLRCRIELNYAWQLLGGEDYEVDDSFILSQLLTVKNYISCVVLKYQCFSIN